MTPQDPKTAPSDPANWPGHRIGRLLGLSCGWRCWVRGEVVVQASDARPSGKANLFDGGGDQTIFDEASKRCVEDLTFAGSSRWSDLTH
jgi:hypothetical protein